MDELIMVLANRDLRIEYLGVSQLRLLANNARTHSKKQVRQIADSIKSFGFTNPVLVDDAGAILAGHGKVAAAKLLGISRTTLWERMRRFGLTAE